MPKKKPTYLLHKPTGQARVRIDGRDIYLGEYGSPTSRERYDDLVSEWFAQQGNVGNYLLTIDDLALQFLEFARGHYQKNGVETTELYCYQLAFRPLLISHGTTRVRDFGPRSLKQIRDVFVEKGYLRRTVNGMIHRIRRMFKWGVAEELVPVEVYQALCTVEGFRAGRTKAAESVPIQPVDKAAVDSTLKFLSPQVAAMVRLQLLTGARPGEVVLIRPCDVTYSTDGLWTYHPASHKTEHHGRERRIFLGPEAQDILRPYLLRPADAYCFSPREAVATLNVERRANRASPMTPSQAARKPRQNPKRPPAERYTRDSYRRAIARACELAFQMPAELRKPPKGGETTSQRVQRLEQAVEWREQNCWHPNQLRHTRATAIREKYGLEAAQVVLGHASPDVTQIYAERDFQLAARVMKEIG